LEPNFVIDFGYIANELTKERRTLLEISLSLVTSLLYNQNYCDLLTNPRNHFGGGRNLPLESYTAETFPTSKIGVLAVAFENLTLNNDIKWSIDTVTECNNPGKSMFTRFSDRVSGNQSYP
jgi:hypothetical protein